MTAEQNSSGSDLSGTPEQATAVQPPAAVQPEPAPVSDNAEPAPAPRVSAYGPAVTDDTTPAPASTPSTPAYAEPARAQQSPAQPAPAYAEPTPTSAQPAPAYAQPTPGYSSNPTAAAAAVGPKGFGLTSMVLGIVGLVLIWTTWIPLILSALSLIFGILAKRRKELPRGYATTGIVLASVTLGLLVIGYLVLIAFSFALSGGAGLGS